MTYVVVCVFVFVCDLRVWFENWANHIIIFMNKKKYIKFYNITALFLAIRI